MWCGTLTHTRARIRIHMHTRTRTRTHTDIPLYPSLPFQVEQEQQSEGNNRVQHALVIDGRSLTFALSPELSALFVDVACRCVSACVRVCVRARFCAVSVCACARSVVVRLESRARGQGVS